MYANVIYYYHCKQKIAETKEKYKELPEQLEHLSKIGGTSSVLKSLIVIAVLFILIKIFFSVFI